MNDENEIFLKQMRGVTQIKKNDRVRNTKAIKKTKWTKNKQKPPTNVLLEKNTTTKIQNTNLSLERVSIKKNIKKNILKIDKKIDFHGKSLLEAEEIFSYTVIDCFNQHKRCLLFITGKGVFKPKNNEESISPKLYHGVIRASFFDWVNSKKLSKYILSYEQASIEHGSDGAFYVYLRKNKN
tara:strand:+ start:23958 stop:24503 length:546 start_codon:yes stop_codon:yes gene_type:complete